jgi:hypothetical protein
MFPEYFSGAAVTAQIEVSVGSADPAEMICVAARRPRVSFRITWHQRIARRTKSGFLESALIALMGRWGIPLRLPAGQKIAVIDERKQQVPPIDLFRSSKKVAHAVRVRTRPSGCTEDIDADTVAVFLVRRLYFCVPFQSLAWNEQQSSDQQRQHGRGDQFVFTGHVRILRTAQ